MSSELTYIYLTHSVYTTYEPSSVFAKTKPQSIRYKQLKYFFLNLYPIDWGKFEYSFILVTCALSRKQMASYLLVMAVSMPSTLTKRSTFYLRCIPKGILSQQSIMQ